MDSLAYGQEFMLPLILAAIGDSEFPGASVMPERPFGRTVGSNGKMKIPIWFSNEQQLPDDIRRAENEPYMQVVGGHFDYVEVEAEEYGGRDVIDIKKKYLQRLEDVGGNSTVADASYMQNVVGQIYRKMEYYRANTINTDANYGTVLNVAAGDRFDNGGNVIKILKAQAKEVYKKSGKKPNLYQCDEDVWDAITENPTVLATMPDGMVKQVTESYFESLLPYGMKLEVRYGSYKSPTDKSLTEYYSTKSGIYVVSAAENEQSWAGTFRDPSIDDVSERVELKSPDRYSFEHGMYRAMSVIDKNCGAILNDCIG